MIRETILRLTYRELVFIYEAINAVMPDETERWADELRDLLEQRVAELGA